MLCCLQSSENDEELSDVKRYERRIYQLYSDSLVALIMEWISNVNSCCAGAVDTNWISAWQLLLSWHGWKESRALILHNYRPQISLAITILVRSFDLKLEKKRGTNERRGRESEKDWQMMYAGSWNLIRAEDRRAMATFVCVGQVLPTLWGLNVPRRKVKPEITCTEGAATIQTRKIA